MCLCLYRMPYHNSQLYGAAAAASLSSSCSPSSSSSLLDSWKKYRLCLSVRPLSMSIEGVRRSLVLSSGTEACSKIPTEWRFKVRSDLVRAGFLDGRRSTLPSCSSRPGLPLCSWAAGKSAELKDLLKASSMKLVRSSPRVGSPGVVSRPEASCCGERLFELLSSRQESTEAALFTRLVAGCRLRER